jgi:hypothetical protein
MKEIPLTRSKIALVDDEDYPELSKFKWHAESKKYGFYACRRVNNQGKINRLSMSRFLMSPPKGLVVDHINHNTLDNCRSNLRVCSVGENCRNRKKPRTNTSGYKGVVWQESRKSWRASLETGDKTVWLGNHGNREDAARAYDVKAKELFGAFAFLNFPEQP